MFDWQITAIMAALISVMISGILVMLAKLFDFKMLEQAAKSELAFAASSVFVAGMLILVVGYGTEIGLKVAKDMYVYTYGSQYLHYTATETDPATGNPVEVDKVMDSTFFDGTVDPVTGQMTASSYSLIEIMIFYMKSAMYCAETIGTTAYWISTVAHWISSLTQDVFMAYPMSGWAWGGLAQSMDNTLNTIYFMELAYRLEIYVLRFMDAFALPVILPLGIVLRAFPPTRGAGAYVISFAIGIYLVFPMAYLVAVLSSQYPNFCATPQIPMPDMGGNSKAGLAWELALWFKAYQGSILNVMDMLSGLSNALISNLCFFPFIALAIAMTFMQFSSGLFGANIPEIGRGLVKLI